MENHPLIVGENDIAKLKIARGRNRLRITYRIRSAGGFPKDLPYALN